MSPTPPEILSIRPNRLAARLLTLVGLALSLALPTLAAAAEPAPTAEVGRGLIERLRPAIMTIRIVVSVGGNQEFKTESSGTVINPDGLTIVSLSDIDPASFLKRLYGSQGEDMEGFNTRVKDIKFVLEDRREIPATVVLRDADLNMAFLRPLTKPEQPMTAVDLTAAAKPLVLDELLVLSRLGPVADREMRAQLGFVSAIMTKPRTFYIPGPGLDALAVPAFTGKGEVIGIVLMRTALGGADMGGGLMGMGQSPAIPVILPAADVLEVAEQAPKDAKPLEEALPAEEADPAGPLKSKVEDAADEAPAEDAAPEE